MLLLWSLAVRAYLPSTCSLGHTTARCGSILAQADVSTRPARGISGTPEGAIVDGPTLTATQLLDERPRSRLAVGEVIDTMMACLHKSHVHPLDRPYLGCEVALRFLSTTHQAASFNSLGGPPAFERYLRQPHKQALATWSEYTLDGPPVVVERAEQRWEAYQQLKVRPSSDSEWQTVRWLLVEEDGTWRVDGVFSEEPDSIDDAFYEDVKAVAQSVPLDAEAQRRLFDEFDADGSGAIDEAEIAQCASRLGIQIDQELLHWLFLDADADGSGVLEFDEFSALLSAANSGSSVRGDFAEALARSVTTESPRAVVDAVMRGMRYPDEPARLDGVAQTVRYCSPTNRASRLSPEAFAAYLEEPWYRILNEWEEMEIDDDDDIDASGSAVEVECLIRRDAGDSFSVVTFQLSRHNARWLIDTLDITE